MEVQNKDLVHARAQRLFPYLNEQLHYDPVDERLGNAFRFCFLVLQSPRKYLDAFKHGELTIDMELVDDLYWEFRAELPEPGGLMLQEKQIITTHNDEVKKYLGQAPMLRVVGLGR